MPRPIDAAFGPGQTFAARGAPAPAPRPHPWPRLRAQGPLHDARSLALAPIDAPWGAETRPEVLRLNAFQGTSKVLGPDTDGRDAALKAWQVALRAPHGGDAPSGSIHVLELVRRIVANVRSSTAWCGAEAWLGGSAALWLLGGLGPGQKPHDLDPIIFVARRPRQTLCDLEAQVLGALRQTYVDCLALTPNQTERLQLRARRVFETDSYGGLLVLRVGHNDAHVDLRFVFADEGVRPFDFLCNAIVCDLGDSGRWCTLGGADATEVLADIEAGIYRATHSLTPGSVVRAWKMACRGLVPADAAQEKRLWQQLAKHLESEAPDECKGPKLRLAEHLHRHLGHQPHRASHADRQSAMAFVLNALTSLEAFGMPKFAGIVADQLRRLLADWRKDVPLSLASATLVDLMAEPSGSARAAAWLALWAAPTTHLTWPTDETRSHLSVSTQGLAGCIRRFVPELDAFVVLYPPHNLAAWAMPRAADAPLPPMAATRQGRAASALGDVRLAALWPHDKADDALECGVAARRLLHMVTQASESSAPEVASSVAAALSLDAEVAVDDATWQMAAGVAGDAWRAQLFADQRRRRLEAAHLGLTHAGSAIGRHKAWQVWHSAFASAVSGTRCGAFEAQDAAAKVLGHRLLVALSHEDLDHDVDAGPVAALCRALGGPSATPELAFSSMAAWLRLRALFGDVAAASVRRALRPGLIAVRCALASGCVDPWQMALAQAAAGPRPKAVLEALLHLVEGPAKAIPKQAAMTYLAHVQPRTQTTSTLRATALALESLASDGEAWSKLWGHTGFVAVLLQSPTRAPALFRVACAHPPLGHPAALSRVMTAWLKRASLGPMPQTWAQDPKARAHLVPLVQTAVGAASNLDDVCRLWRRTEPVLEQACEATGPFVVALLEAVGRAYLAQRPQGAGPTARSPVGVPLRWREHVALHAAARPLEAQLGLSCLLADFRDVPGAFAQLVAYAPDALAHDGHAEAFFACATHLLMQMPEGDNADREVLRHLAGIVVKAPKLARHAHRVARAWLARFAVHCSDARAFEPAIKSLVHARAVWQMEDVGAALDGHLNIKAPWLTRANWFITLAWGFNDMRYVPLVSSLAEPFAVREVEGLSRQWCQAPSDAEKAHLDLVLTLSRSYGRVVPRHKEAPLVRALRQLFRVLPDTTTRPLLFDDDTIVEHKFGGWSWLWLAWVEAAPNREQAHMRASDVAARVGMGAFEDGRGDVLSQQATNILMYLTPWLSFDPTSGALDDVAWRTLAQACIANNPPLWWLHALMHGDAAHRLVRAHMLVERLEDACRADIVVRRPNLEQRNRQVLLGLSLLYTAAHHLGPDDEARAVRAARLAMTLARDFWDRDPGSWHIALDAVCRAYPAARLPLMPLLDKVAARQKQVRKLRAQSYPEWMLTSIAPMMGDNEPDVVMQGLHLLVQSEGFWPDDTRLVSAWRTTLTALARQKTGRLLLLRHLEDDWPASPAPLRNLGLLFECWVDACALEPRAWLGMVGQMQAAAARAIEHPRLEALLARMTAHAQQAPPTWNASVQTRVAAWIATLPRQSSLSVALRALLTAIRSARV